MPYVKPEEIEAARKIDLLTYLRLREPGELVRVSGNTYTTREHDSVKISNGKWYWFSKGFGGVSALDYLIKVRGYTFLRAVETVSGKSAAMQCAAPKEPEPKKLLLPEMNRTADRVSRYLRNRGIDPEIIRYCLYHQILYESKAYHNAVFIGRDEHDEIRYAAIRGTLGSYKSEAVGSDKHYSFRIAFPENSAHLHLFESAIDLLSYATLLKMDERDWKQDALLSLAGVYQTKRENVVPIALERFLETHRVDTIHLHLDNDDAGRAAARGICKGLENRYTVLNEPPTCGKDVNDQLMIQLTKKGGTLKNDEHCNLSD